MRLGLGVGVGVGVGRDEDILLPHTLDAPALTYYRKTYRVGGGGGGGAPPPSSSIKGLICATKPLCTCPPYIRHTGEAVGSAGFLSSRERTGRRVGLVVVLGGEGAEVEESVAC